MQLHVSLDGDIYHGDHSLDLTPDKSTTADVLHHVCSFIRTRDSNSHVCVQLAGEARPGEDYAASLGLLFRGVQRMTDVGLNSTYATISSSNKLFYVRATYAKTQCKQLLL